MKPFLLALVFAVAVVTPALGQERLYMGKASTGEPVWYNGARAQCGDLPRAHECWQNPMVSYTIGSDHVSAIPDCKKGVFKEVWIGDRVVSRSMRPASQALRSVLETACNAVSKAKTALHTEPQAVPHKVFLSAQATALPAPDNQGDYFYTLSSQNAFLRGLVWTVQSDQLNCRQKAGINQPIVQRLDRGHMIGAPSQGQPFVRDPEGQSWLKVYVPSKSACYVRANLQFIKPSFIENF